MDSALLRVGLLALILASFKAQAEVEYPAADFQPQVIYSAPTEEGKYPAASFTPQVVFQDPELIEKLAAPPKAPAPQAAAPKEPSRPRSSVAFDAAPPYGAAGLALAAIALTFFWARRSKAPALYAGAESNPAAATKAGEASQESVEAVREDLEELAVEVEQTLATTNRQRAGKSKRTRRR
ncbi:hypothetical protein JCM13664_18800 [Methylothermus subterraneus]